MADTDLDSDVDGSDLCYDSSFDERWRMVATYRSTDANPKERFLHHQAGAQREMAPNSAYGVPIGLHVGNTNSDGGCDQADQSQLRDWALATPAVHDVRGDRYSEQRASGMDTKQIHARRQRTPWPVNRTVQAAVILAV